MKIVCSKNNLLKALNTVSRAVPVRTTLEILKCVLIKADPECITLTANDTNLGIETRLFERTEEPGLVAVDAGLFTNIIRKLPDDDIYIETDASNAMTIKCRQSVFKIAGRETDEFVMLPDIRPLSSVVCSEYTVREMIGQVIFSIAESDLNAAMSGVYIEIYDNHMKMTTLDGHRISIRVSELKEAYESASAIVPGKTLSDLSRILSGGIEDDMTILFAKNHIIFEFDNTRMVSRLIDGQYFRVESMIRPEYNTCVKISKRELSDCLDRSTLFVNESDKKPVILTITDEEMNLKLKSNIGSMDESLFIEKEGGDLKIAFNPKLLLDALRVIDDETISMYMFKYNYPCTIKNDEGTYTYVVLPVNFTEE